jgi:hypothetical protein
MEKGLLAYPAWRNNVYIRNLYRNFDDSTFATYYGAFFTLNRNYNSDIHKILHLHWIADLFAINERNWFLFFFRYGISMMDLLWLKYFRKAHIVWTVHNLYAHDCFHPVADLFARCLLGKLADKVIVHGNRAVPLILKQFRVPLQKVFVIDHGNFLEDYPNNISQQEARKALDIPLG